MSENRKRNLFITLEGGEGAGKSTLISKLTQALTEKGIPVLQTREPGGGALGEHIRHLLLNPALKGKIALRAELFLFLAARAQHVAEVIDPALINGQMVLCDRFHDSTLAYQGFARGLGVSQVEHLCLFASHGLVPDLTLYLDLDPTLGLKRTQAVIKEHQVPDRIEAEAISFHECVRKGFLLLAERYPHRIEIIDATLSPEEVFSKALKAIDQLIALATTP